MALALCVALALPCRATSGAARPSPPSAPVAPAPSRLVLVVVVDQMRYDYLTRFRTLFTGGLHRLLDQGAVFSNAHVAYAPSETAPGHSVVLTGRIPAHTGIVANAWYDPALRRRVDAVDDPSSVPLEASGRAASPRAELGPTLAEALKQARPASRVVAVSFKDRAAIFLAGRGADAAFWMSSATGHFTSSSYYMREAPAWLVPDPRRSPADRYAGSFWTRLLPDVALYRRLAGEDAVTGEAVDATFPHPLPRPTPKPKLIDAVRRTPFADEMVADAALEAIAGYHLGEEGHTDILGVSFSATDAIGHAYGPDSQEMMDQIVRLDRTLQKLLNGAERRVGGGHTLVVLAADHGIMPLVEILKARGRAARRVTPNVLETAVRKTLAARFPGAREIVSLFEGPDVYLDLPALEAQHLQRAQVEEVVRQALLGTGLVATVYTQAQMQGPPPPKDPYFELYRNSFYASRSPHLIARLKPHIYFSDHATGTGHGSPYDYDRHVPIIFMGPGVRAGERREACGPEDIAPTLAQWLGIPYPGTDGRPLSIGDGVPAH